MKKKGISSIKTKFTREELLGEGNYFHLDQSEYICKKIIDQILFLTFQQVRFDNVKEMQYDYSAYTTILNLQSIVNLGLIRPEIEYEKEINYEINFDIKPSIIDSWASNKAKMINKYEPKEIPVPPQKKESVLSPSKKYERPKTIKRTSLPKNLEELMNKNIDNKDNVIKEKKTVPRELPMEAFPLDIEEKETLNEIEQMKIKGFRTYFAEKEIENQKRKILEMEQAERAKEEQKKVKQVMELINSSNLVSWDSDGRFLPLKYIKESEMKNFPEPKSQINRNDIFFDTDKLYNLDKFGHQKMPKDIEVTHLPVQIEERKEKFYQPDPLKSHKISKGIVMDFYGVKKDGGEFDKGDGRLTFHQFLDQLALNRPYDVGNMDLEKNQNYIDHNLPQIDEKDDENNSIKKKGTNKQSVPNFTRLYYLFRDEINAKNVEVKGKKKGRDILKKKKRIVTSSYGIKSEVNGKVEENLKFKIDDIKENNDQSLYNALKSGGPEVFLGNMNKIETVKPERREGFTKSARNRNVKRNIQSATQRQKKFLPKSIIKAIDKMNQEDKNEIVLPDIKQKKMTGKGIYDSNNQ